MSAPTVRGIGVDVASVPRVGTLAERYADDVLGHVFTDRELRAAGSGARRARRLAVCFAAKEATGKALACRLADMPWTDVESIQRGPRLSVALRGAAERRGRELGVSEVLASWAVWDDHHVLVHVLLV